MASIIQKGTEELPLISVVFPVFNVEKWVEEALGSICCQSYRNLEIIVVNDGSIDGSRSICKEFADNDSRVLLVDQVNGGLSAARNSGIKIAKGEYLLFVDSDDVIHRDHIMLLYECLSRHKVDISLTVMTNFSNEYNVMTPLIESDIELSSHEAIKTMLYQGSFDSCAQAKLYKKELWNDIEFPVGYLHEDLVTTYKVFLKTDRIVFFNSDTYGYRFNGNGINHSAANDKKVMTLSLLDEMVYEIGRYEKRDLLKAAKCLRESFCLHLLLNATDDSMSKSNQQKLYASIIKDRLEVIFDPYARAKTRGALILSFFGRPALKKAFAIFQRKRVFG